MFAVASTLTHALPYRPDHQINCCRLGLVYLSFVRVKLRFRSKHYIHTERRSDSLHAVLSRFDEPLLWIPSLH